MNGRIQELSKQAYELQRHKHGGYFTQQLLLDAFAELIVRECSNYIGNKAMLAGGACTIVGEEGLWLSKDLLEHFGVKE